MRRFFVSASPALFVTLLASAAYATTDDLGAPFGVLPLVDEVNAADANDPHALYEDPPGATKVADVLGKPARVLAMTDDAEVFAYKIGAHKGLVAGKPYVLVVEYPEDVGRQFVVINRGAEMTRTYATGPTIGDSRESYTYPAPESLKYPLSGKWQSVRTLFWLGEKYQGVKGARDTSSAQFTGTPDDGFWVVIGHFRKKDSPLDAGAAVARIRLFAVTDEASLALNPHYPPADLPRRHVFWREEMADVAFTADDSGNRFFADSSQWFEAKMKQAEFLGVNTYSRHLLVFGYTQQWDTTPYGGNAWFYTSSQSDLWPKMVASATAHGMDVLPYYEYAGAMGGGSGGTASLGQQRRCRPLGDRPNNAYSDVSWSENACADVTDPDFETDVDHLLDATITRYKDQAKFVGAWFRTRNSNWPISFTDATLARFGKDANGGTAPTRAQLQADATLLKSYYAWWFGKRRDFLVHIRDHLKSAVDPNAAVLFTSYVEEALHVPEYSDWATPTDDVPTWNTINGEAPWQYRFAPTDWSAYVSAGKFLEMTTRMTPPTAAVLANHQPESDHSAPPADPKSFADVDDVYMTMPFSRLFTVSSKGAFDAFRAKSGLAIARHFCLNEEDGQNASAPDGPMSKRVGYFVTDVDHTGPYSMMAEARAVAFGDPRFVGYLSSSNFSRGFPEYTRAFDAAYLALPALPSSVESSAANDAEVVVRAIPTASHGTYYAIVNTGLNDKTNVTIHLATPGSAHDLVANTELGASSGLTLSFYPGELKAIVVGGDSTDVDAGAPSDGGSGGDAGVAPNVDSGAPSDAGAAATSTNDAGGCSFGRGEGASTGGFALALLLAAVTRRRAARA